MILCCEKATVSDSYMLVASGASLYVDRLLLLLDAKAVEFENQELVFSVSLSTLACFIQ